MTGTAESAGSNDSRTRLKVPVFRPGLKAILLTTLLLVMVTSGD